MADQPEPPGPILVARTGADLYPSHTGLPLARVDDSGRFADGFAGPGAGADDPLCGRLRRCP